MIGGIFVRKGRNEICMLPTLYELFKHWSDGSSVYILSDLHFDDADCKFMDLGGLHIRLTIKSQSQNSRKY